MNRGMLRRRREIWKYETTTILKKMSHVNYQGVEHEATTLSPDDIVDHEEDESGRDADDGGLG